MQTPDFLVQAPNQDNIQSDVIIEEQANENGTVASGTFIIATKDGTKTPTSGTHSINSDSYEDKEN